MEENDIIERLNMFINESGLSRSQFADTCGIPRPTATQILSGKNKKIGNDVIECIHRAYPAIPMMWLIFGEGEKPIFMQDQPSEIPLGENVSEVSDVDVARKEQTEPPLVRESIAKQYLSSSKAISKIVVFYTDNSFEEYFLKK